MGEIVEGGMRKQVDWKLVCGLLAQGRSTGEVAFVAGCSRQHVWRILRRSKAVRARVAELRRRDRAEYGARLHSLRGVVVETLQRAVETGNVRVALWLADRLGVARYGLLEAVDEVSADSPDEVDTDTAVDASEGFVTPIEGEVTCLPDQEVG